MPRIRCEIIPKPPSWERAGLYAASAARKPSPWTPSTIKISVLAALPPLPFCKTRNSSVDRSFPSMSYAPCLHCHLELARQSADLDPGAQESHARSVTAHAILMSCAGDAVGASRAPLCVELPNHTAHYEIFELRQSKPLDNAIALFSLLASFPLEPGQSMGLSMPAEWSSKMLFNLACQSCFMILQNFSDS